MTSQKVAMSKAVREARKEAGLSQETAAQRIGVSLKTYQRWEGSKGKRDNISHRLELIAACLDTTPEDIAGRALAISGRPPSLAPTEVSAESMNQAIVDLRGQLEGLKAQVERVKIQQEALNKKLPPDE